MRFIWWEALTSSMLKLNIKMQTVTVFYGCHKGHVRKQLKQCLLLIVSMAVNYFVLFDIAE
jgi:hypothetical protein